jgi:hypothetical protein
MPFAGHVCYIVTFIATAHSTIQHVSAEMDHIALRPSEKATLHGRYLKLQLCLS